MGYFLKASPDGAAPVVRCAMCNRPVAFDVLTSEHPEAPDLVSPPISKDAEDRAWVGATYDHVEGASIVVACGSKCAAALLRE